MLDIFDLKKGDEIMIKFDIATFLPSSDKEILPVIFEHYER